MKTSVTLFRHPNFKRSDAARAETPSQSRETEEQRRQYARLDAEVCV